jgi:hypothetical protein
MPLPMIVTVVLLAAGMFFGGPSAADQPPTKVPGEQLEGTDTAYKHRSIDTRTFTAVARVGYPVAPVNVEEGYTRLTVDIESKKPEWQEVVSSGTN